jgi:hypothetical protein
MEVQEVFKGDGHSGIAGGRVEVIQDAGEVELSDKRIQVNPGFQPFREGGEYILFLEWNDVLNAYDILYGPSATFVIFNDAVDTPAPRGPARQFRGMRLDTFTGLLRNLGNAAAAYGIPKSIDIRRDFQRRSSIRPGRTPSDRLEPAARTNGSSTGSSTDAAELLPPGPCPLGSRTPMNGSSNGGGTAPRHRSRYRDTSDLR